MLRTVRGAGRAPFGWWGRRGQVGPAASGGHRRILSRLQRRRGARLQPRGRESLHAPALGQVGRQHGLQPRGLRGSVESEVGGGHGSLQTEGEAGSLSLGGRRTRAGSTQTSGCCSDRRIRPPTVSCAVTHDADPSSSELNGRLGLSRSPRVRPPDAHPAGSPGHRPGNGRARRPPAQLVLRVWDPLGGRGRSWSSSNRPGKVGLGGSSQEPPSLRTPPGGCHRDAGLAADGCRPHTS